MNPTTLQIVGLSLFTIAVLHTFSVKYFERLSHAYPNHAGVFHFLGEVEAVFGFWAMVLVTFMFFTLGKKEAVDYVQGRNYTEPMFVFVIMVIAASKPIVSFVAWLVRTITTLLPITAKKRILAFYFLVLALVPLMGSFITEPAAMTLAAMMIRDQIFKDSDISTRLKYLTVGVLFVNVSIGGVLTSYAAPPVLMVAATWGWDTKFMFLNFGWEAMVAVSFNALVLTLIGSKELAKVGFNATRGRPDVPWSVVMVSLAFLAGVVVFAHYAALFMGIFLFFLGFATAYDRYQDRLILKEALMVGFFLAGLVVLGGQQAWWLQPLLTKLSPDAVYFGATALTAVTDNAALTYLASLVPGLSDEFKYMVVAGAVTGGGLTVIANAPNPAGYSILKGSFSDSTISPLGLLAAALPPTCVAIFCFYGLHKLTM
ncbi:MAG: putative Na+/H+ antiporter [Casimicrobium sp.]